MLFHCLDPFGEATAIDSFEVQEKHSKASPRKYRYEPRVSSGYIIVF